MSDDGKRGGPHDLGGLPGGPVDRDEADIAYWERRVEAALYLAYRKGLLQDTAELRVGIESLGESVYEKLSYYERWAASLASRLVARGVLDQATIDARITAMGDRD